MKELDEVFFPKIFNLTPLSLQLGTTSSIIGEVNRTVFFSS